MARRTTNSTAKSLALARRFGREDDVLALNFLVASGVKDSSTFNPFATGNPDALRELLASQLGEQQVNDSNGVFRGRAIALIGTMAPVLVYMRDVKGISDQHRDHPVRPGTEGHLDAGHAKALSGA